MFKTFAPRVSNQVLSQIYQALLTRQEAGFIQYDLLQNQSDPTDFTFVEEWESNEALDMHLASPYLQAVAARIPELAVEGPDIRRYTLIS